VFSEGPASSEFIFVYGTLRRGSWTDSSRLLSEQCEYISEGCIHGRLYEVDGYPGLVLSHNPEEKVFGDVYSIGKDRSILARLDRYEECAEDCPEPHEYSRVKIGVELNGGRSIAAWVYLYNPDVSGLKRIESGCYLAQLRKNG
jgi:gamma-glutamylcyclotransferase (GGCT)/AIG2-like uncharacterized protein YtfP